MKRSEAKELQKKYGMEILRHPVTREAWGLGLETDVCIPELDRLVRTDIWPCVMTASYMTPDDGAIYRLACPTSWLNLWGWADE